MSLPSNAILAAENRHLSTFQLNPSLKDKLLAAGFRVLRDLKGVGPVELSKGTKVVVTNLCVRTGGRKR